MSTRQVIDSAATPATPMKVSTMLHTLLASPDQQTLAAGFILSGIKGIFYLLGGIIAAIICGLIAKSKGYSAILFAILGFFFSIITLIVILVIPRRR